MKIGVHVAQDARLTISYTSCIYVANNQSAAHIPSFFRQPLGAHARDNNRRVYGALTAIRNLVLLRFLWSTKTPVRVFDEPSTSPPVTSEKLYTYSHPLSHFLEQLGYS